MKSIDVRYFGILGERRGLVQERLTTAATTTASLYAELDLEHRLGLEPKNFRVAVNDAFSTWDQPLADGDQVAFLPPMSGG